MSKCFAVASGKGGVGKSVLTANLAAALASNGTRVLIVDADIGLRSQDAMLSLEDRVVKQCFQRLHHPCTCPPKIPVCICGKKPQVDVLGGACSADEDEVRANPRSRSAKLRVAVKREVS